MRIHGTPNLKTTYGSASLNAASDYVFTAAMWATATCATAQSWGASKLYFQISGDAGANFDNVECRDSSGTALYTYPSYIATVATYSRIHNGSAGALSYVYTGVYL